MVEGQAGGSRALPLSKIDPMLASALADPKAGERMRLIVGFQDDLVIPRFPDLDPTRPRGDSVNVQTQLRSDALVAHIQSRRSAGYQALTAELARLDIYTVSTYWLVKGMVVDAPRSAIDTLAQRKDVSYLEPIHTGEPPPDSDPATTRSRPGPSWVPTRSSTCPRSTGASSGSCGNYGTSTMAVITGNANLGDRLRGISAITTDSLKVYDCITEPVTGQRRAGLNRDAATQGLQTAVSSDRPAVRPRPVPRTGRDPARGQDLQPVSGRLSSNYRAGPGPQRPAQLGDASLRQAARLRRWALAPQGVHQPINRQHPVGVEQLHSE